MTTPENRSVESYKHKFAKQTLTQWLRELGEAAYKDNDTYARIGDISWRTNRGEPTWGIFEEYPVSKSVEWGGYVHAWDETYWGTVPTFEQLVKAGDRPDIIFDVAIQHKGSIIYAFEVVHKHPVTEYKAGVLNRLDVETYTINAEWILQQVQRPTELRLIHEYGRCAYSKAIRRAA